MKKELIQTITAASGVSAGETVLVHFWGEDSDKAIANEFMAAVAALGATPILLQQSRSINYEIFYNAGPLCFDEAYFRRFSELDAVLDIFTYPPIVLGRALEDDQQTLYRNYIRKLFSTLMQAKRFAQIRVPTAANAADSGLEPEDYIRRMEQAYDLDPKALRTRCEKAASDLSGAAHLALHTGQGHTLHFDVSGRKWYTDAGDGDWPCGEIYIAPREDRTHGTVWFSHLYLEELGRLDHVTLTIQNGRITGSDHKAVDDLIRSLPPAHTVIAELGFGMNPKVQDLCGCTVLDEKMDGGFHLGLGANIMFGGENDVPFHLDLAAAGPYHLEKTNQEDLPNDRI